jgi:hypothetical protein
MELNVEERYLDADEEANGTVGDGGGRLLSVSFPRV